MSEQKMSFMQELDHWTDANVITPAFNATQDDWEPAVAEVKKAIREKVLESYKNGCKAGAGHARKEFREGGSQPVRKERGYAQAQAR